ncbi:unnamed protein product, partial [Prunus brigantina]
GGCGSVTAIFCPNRKPTDYLRYDDFPNREPTAICGKPYCGKPQKAVGYRELAV